MPGYEQRRTVRVPLLIPVKVRSSIGTFQGQGRDISMGGIGVYLQRLPPEGSMIEVRLSLPKGDKPIEVTGEVVYVKRGGPADNWMGIRFTRMDADSAAALRSYVTKIHGSEHIEGPAPPPLPSKR